MDHSECFEVQNSKYFRGCAPKPPGGGGGGGGGDYNASRLASCYYTRFASVARYARMLGKLSGLQTNFRFHPCTLSRWKVFAGKSCACRLQTFLSTTGEARERVTYMGKVIRFLLYPIFAILYYLIEHHHRVKAQVCDR